MERPLRLVIFDATQTARAPRALGLAWKTGSELYRGLGWIDAAYGARDFATALDWAARIEPARHVAELQFWGHGKWGSARIDREIWDRGALAPGHALRPHLEALRERLTPDALIWFRSCETLGARAGQDFACALSDFTGAAVAGHTFVIGYYQSGLHVLEPGATPDWAQTEGLAHGTPDEPRAALKSGPARPSTITCFTNRVPERLRSASRAA